MRMQYFSFSKRNISNKEPIVLYVPDKHIVKILGFKDSYNTNYTRESILMLALVEDKSPAMEAVQIYVFELGDVPSNIDYLKFENFGILDIKTPTCEDKTVCILGRIKQLGEA